MYFICWDLEIHMANYFESGSEKTTGSSLLWAHTQASHTLVESYLNHMNLTALHEHASKQATVCMYMVCVYNA